MTTAEYQRDALRTMPTRVCSETLLNGVLGLCGEAGECADLVKKAKFQGHKLDKEHLAKELGDVAWYLATTAHSIGYTMDTILEMNVQKRKERYPDGFSSDLSINRKDGDV